MKRLYWLLLVAGCSTEEAAAPSRPPVPAPNTTADAGADGSSSSAECFDAATTKPTEPKQFLNQCNSAECFKFDNGARIEGFTPGSALPPLN